MQHFLNGKKNRLQRAVRQGMFVEGAGDAFFRINERKLNALLEATQRDMERAE